jgi:type III secretory pathway component EscS
MPTVTLVHDAQRALWLVVAVSLPVVGVAAIVGLITAAFQAASQIQDPTLAHLPRMIVVIAALDGSYPRRVRRTDVCRGTTVIGSSPPRHLERSSRMPERGCRPGHRR